MFKVPFEFWLQEKKHVNRLTLKLFFNLPPFIYLKNYSVEFGTTFLGYIFHGAQNLCLNNTEIYYSFYEDQLDNHALLEDATKPYVECRG